MVQGLRGQSLRAQAARRKIFEMWLVVETGMECGGDLDEKLNCD